MSKASPVCILVILGLLVFFVPAAEDEADVDHRVHQRRGDAVRICISLPPITEDPNTIAGNFVVADTYDAILFQAHIVGSEEVNEAVFAPSRPASGLGLSSLDQNAVGLLRLIAGYRRGRALGIPLVSVLSSDALHDGLVLVVAADTSCEEPALPARHPQKGLPSRAEESVGDLDDVLVLQAHPHTVTVWARKDAHSDSVLRRHDVGVPHASFPASPPGRSGGPGSDLLHLALDSVDSPPGNDPEGVLVPQELRTHAGEGRAFSSIAAFAGVSNGRRRWARGDETLCTVHEVLQGPQIKSTLQKIAPQGGRIKEVCSRILPRRSGVGEGNGGISQADKHLEAFPEGLQPLRISEGELREMTSIAGEGAQSHDRHVKEKRQGRRRGLAPSAILRHVPRVALHQAPELVHQGFTDLLPFAHSAMQELSLSSEQLEAAVRRGGRIQSHAKTDHHVLLPSKEGEEAVQDLETPDAASSVRVALVQHACQLDGTGDRAARLCRGSKLDRCKHALLAVAGLPAPQARSAAQAPADEAQHDRDRLC
eukprot:scaffold7346_cov245-Pinguiococcus_pyrenoidosus.AAC.11